MAGGKGHKQDNSKIVVILSGILILIVGFNFILTGGIASHLDTQDVKVDSIYSSISKKASTGSSSNVQLTGDINQDVFAILFSRGVPEIYGNEIGVSFEDVQGSIKRLAMFDAEIGDRYSGGGTAIKFQQGTSEFDRLVRLGNQPTITCEFCCGAKTLISGQGRRTCGCEHAVAMSGLLSYLLKNHPDLSDDQITRELARWKAMFFPKQMVSRFLEQAQTGKYTPDIAALLIGIDTSKLNIAEAGSIKDALANVPSMVGGC